MPTVDMKTFDGKKIDKETQKNLDKVIGHKKWKVRRERISKEKKQLLEEQLGLKLKDKITYLESK